MFGGRTWVKYEQKGIKGNQLGIVLGGWGGKKAFSLIGKRTASCDERRETDL